MIFADEVDWCLKDCDEQRLQTTLLINVWKIFAGIVLYCIVFVFV